MRPLLLLVKGDLNSLALHANSILKTLNMALSRQQITQPTTLSPLGFLNAVDH